MFRQESDSIHTLLAGEDRLLEQIFSGAPLPQVLDTICTAIDLQMGNVISLVVFRDNSEHFLHTIEQKAALCGLSEFCSQAIVSTSEGLLGTFEMYSCFQRSPNPEECKLIQRAADIASLAIQQHFHRQESGSACLHCTTPMWKRSREGSHSSN